MENLKQRITEILEMVEGIPEPYNQIAFKEILRKELSNSYSSDGNEVRSSHAVSNKAPEKDSSLNDWERELLNDLPKAFLVAESGSRDQQCIWGIITLHGRGEEPTNEAIRIVIRDELGITPQNKSNTARTLRNLTPKFLSRQKEGKTYIYRPTRNSVKIFDDLTNN